MRSRQRSDMSLVPKNLICFTCDMRGGILSDLLFNKTDYDSNHNHTSHIITQALTELRKCSTSAFR